MQQPNYLTFNSIKYYVFSKKKITWKGEKAATLSQHRGHKGRRRSAGHTESEKAQGAQ